MHWFSKFHWNPKELSLLLSLQVLWHLCYTKRIRFVHPRYHVWLSCCCFSGKKTFQIKCSHDYPFNGHFITGYLSVSPSNLCHKRINNSLYLSHTHPLSLLMQRSIIISGVFNAIKLRIWQKQHCLFCLQNDVLGV